eukprot:1428726-Pleurochrysis_carterae.AAC.3
MRGFWATQSSILPAVKPNESRCNAIKWAHIVQSCLHEDSQRAATPLRRQRKAATLRLTNVVKKAIQISMKMVVQNSTLQAANI